jgi:tRNA modification GTPase
MRHRWQSGIAGQFSDTIFALSSGGGGGDGSFVRSAVAIVRVSGPRARCALEQLLRGAPRPPSAASGDRAVAAQQLAALPHPRVASVRQLRSVRSGEALDEAMVLWLPGPRTFTGEDVAELHVHGSLAVVSGVLDELGDMRLAPAAADTALAAAGAAPTAAACSSCKERLRPAAPGEFTRRAFGNGRLNLLQVEALADLLAADTEQQRAQALAQLGGHMAARYSAWRHELLIALAHVEAVIDFGDDEDDVDGAAVWDAVRPRVAAVTAAVEVALGPGGASRGELVRSGLRVAIVGPPNAGKSSLLNALAQRDVAIVADKRGTTRDVLEVRLNVGGYPVTLCDTAGLRDRRIEVEHGTAEEGSETTVAALDPVELIGMARAREQIEEAAVTIRVLDSQALWKKGGGPRADDVAMAQATLREEARSELLRLGLLEGEGAGAGGARLSHGRRATSLLVLNKADLLADELRGGELGADSSAGGDHGCVPLYLSCKTGAGVDALLAALEELVQQRLGCAGGGESGRGVPEGGGDGILLTRARHRAHLKRCADALAGFLAAAGGGSDGAPELPALPLDLAAEELRVAVLELGRVTGRVDVEELLDVIFGEFCIGK